MNLIIRAALTLTGVAVLTACGTSYSTSAVPLGVETQSRAHKASGSSGDLLYVLNYEPPGKWRLRGFTLPVLQQVSNERLKATGGLCSDADGNIFIPQFQVVDEYAHGGKRPIETLSDPGYRGFDCAVDNTTGNLAVTNTSGQKSIPGNVVVYKGAKGSPLSYTDPQLLYYEHCGYDSSGNLFVVGVTQQNQNILAELPKGTDSFINITLDKGIYPGAVHWDGSYIVVQGSSNVLYRVQVSGSSGTVVGTTTLNGVPPRGINDFWINGDEVAATVFKLGLWPYPKGGKASQLLSIRGDRPLEGVTVSVAPPR